MSLCKVLPDGQMDVYIEILEKLYEKTSKRYRPSVARRVKKQERRQKELKFDFLEINENDRINDLSKKFDEVWNRYIFYHI